MQSSAISELEKESIDYFVSFVQILGLPKSVGQIYGLMFVSPEPLTMVQLIERLDISKGSASQGLATLKSIGVIIPTQVPGDRREHYQADLQVSRIVNHFFNNRLEPRLEIGETRLARMMELADDESHPKGNTILSRLTALHKWHTRGRKAIPFIKRFLKLTLN